jgi:hypothetical protein
MNTTTIDSSDANPYEHKLATLTIEANERIVQYQHGLITLSELGEAIQRLGTIYDDTVFEKNYYANSKG